MADRIQALLVRLLFACIPGAVVGLVLSVLAGTAIGLFVGVIFSGFGWDMTRPIPGRGEGGR